MKPFTVLVIIACMCAWATPPARAARIMQHCDTDSLCSMAELIVAAEVGKATSWHTADGDCTNFEVTVRSTFKGTAPPGTVLRVAGLDKIYRAPGMAGVADSWIAITAGDVVYLFLIPVEAREGYTMYKLTDAQYKVIESGVRLAVSGRVYAFGQNFYMGRWRHAMEAGECQIPGGPYASFVAMTQKSFPGALVEPTATFEDHLKSSIRFTADLQHKLDTHQLQPTERKTILGGRAKTLQIEHARDDRIAESLGERSAWERAATQP